MARVTVEDCVVKVPNRFELVVLAAQRVQQIVGGAPLTVERKNDKNPVVALREIAEGTIALEPLWGEVVHGFRSHVELDDTEREMADMLSEEQGLGYDIDVASDQKALEDFVESEADVDLSEEPLSFEKEVESISVLEASFVE